jgi:hypothetical protein
MSLSLQTKKAILSKLAEIGETAFESRRAEMIPPMPDSNSLEIKLRYLLLWSLLNQRTEAKIAGKVAYSLLTKFGERLFFEPLFVIKRFGEVASIFQESQYPVRFAYLNRDSVATLLVGSFLCFMIKLNDNEELLEQKAREGPTRFLSYLKHEKLMAPLGEKAARMLVGFVGHPKLDLTAVKYRKEELFVFVDGTVGKVFARTGLVEEIPAYRGNQVYATRMRTAIDTLVRDLKVGDPMMVDGGAYALGQFCCDDAKPSCTNCSWQGDCLVSKICLKKCPLSDIGCAKQIRWMAYRT